ncbi:MAG: CBS domain-containing protein [Spirochaetes bacterium]|jgi:CBS domain-containing protein|nr:CBS domain-containing protein [Spirochaetota bacterium]
METARDILQDKGRKIHSVSPDESVKEALLAMSRSNVGALLVIDDSHKVVGIFSERDYARRMIDCEKGSAETKVREIMSSEITAISEERTVEECMALMTKRRVRHLPVFADNELVGVISIGDVVNAVIHQQAIVIDQLEHYISGSL